MLYAPPIDPVLLDSGTSEFVAYMKQWITEHLGVDTVEEVDARTSDWIQRVRFPCPLPGVVFQEKNKMGQKPLFVGYLTYGRAPVFLRTFESHAESGLHGIGDPFVFVNPHPKEYAEDLAVVSQKNIPMLTSATNVGIHGGIMALVESARSGGYPFFMFSENDFYIDERLVAPEIVERTIRGSLNILEHNVADVVYLRSHESPGPPLFSQPSDPVAWEEWIARNPGHRFPYVLEALSWCGNLDSLMGLPTATLCGQKWSLTDNAHQRWSNNVFIVRTEWFFSNLSRFLATRPNLDAYSGLEKAMGRAGMSFRAAAPRKGLFTHADRLQTPQLAGDDAWGKCPASWYDLRRCPRSRHDKTLFNNDGWVHFFGVGNHEHINNAIRQFALMVALSWRVSIPGDHNTETYLRHGMVLRKKMGDERATLPNGLAIIVTERALSCSEVTTMLNIPDSCHVRLTYDLQKGLVRVPGVCDIQDPMSCGDFDRVISRIFATTNGWGGPFKHPDITEQTHT